MYISVGSRMNAVGWMEVSVCFYINIKMGYESTRFYITVGLMLNAVRQDLFDRSI